LENYHNFINFLSGLKNSNKVRKLSTWKDFNSEFPAPFEMITIKMIAYNLYLSQKQVFLRPRSAPSEFLKKEQKTRRF
jgi:hypothetical protein